MFYSETKLIVRYAETDQMGIVHHSNYPVWFEAGRTDFIKKIGLPYSKFEEMGIMLPLIELNCAYEGFSKYEDEIIVRTAIKEFTKTRLSFLYEVFRNNNPVRITKGETAHVWTDRQLKPVNIKKAKPEIYDLIISIINNSEQ